MEYTQLFGGVEIFVPTPARLTWRVEKLYTPLGVESLVNDRGAYF
jgi:hypothetical protein